MGNLESQHLDLFSQPLFFYKRHYSCVTCCCRSALQVSFQRKGYRGWEPKAAPMSPCCLAKLLFVESLLPLFDGSPLTREVTTSLRLAIDSCASARAVGVLQHHLAVT